MRLRSGCDRREEGATLVEVLAAMGILALIAVCSWMTVSLSLGAAQRASLSLKDSRSALTALRVLREYAFRVRVPFWEAGQGFLMQEGMLCIPYLDGKRDSVLAVSLSDDALVVKAGGEALSLPGFSGADLSFYYGEEESRVATGPDAVPLGISIELSGSRGSDSSGRTLEVVLSFGGRGFSVFAGSVGE